ncbi:MAG: hypothetical protein UR94_C0021G0012 [Parcubacteria group bacterium GW2011_GWA2_36_10]|nr:MAG: hypothetical protein UR94_C0021G0012 [Parcubacteria group bacterium GW2011_GWA2_36_10]
MWKELIKRYIIYGLLMIIALRFVSWISLKDRRLGVLRAFALAMGFGFGIFGLLVFVLAFCSLFKFYLGTIIAVPLFLFLKSKKVPPLPQATRF